MIRSSAGGTEDGSSLDGLNEFNLALRRDGGPSPQNPSEVVMAKEAGGGGFGPMGRTKGPKGKEKALEEETGPRLGPFLDKSKSSGLSLSCLKDFGVQPGGPSVKKKKGSAENQPKKGPLEALAQSGLPGEANFELEFLSSREKEIESDQKANPHYVLADSALEEEALRFWNDMWCGDSALSQRFPHLYILAAHRNALVEDMRDQNAGEGSWNLRFIRDFNDWEVEMVGELLQVLRGFRITREEDSVCWKGGGSGQFKVKDAYNWLDRPMDVVFPKNKIWMERVPTKIMFFAWKATWGKILTLDRLQKRG
ncbi:hypothetical protein VitviT2T_028622 [Vitis vinifera]|uniref:Reverse transcriptase zinc-binding domain-containing protein n=1 Tax=Vitis vinifera TaxID=29760 RepID=A0ABY9DV99_VITVI|nr:hypothetical protein VitviT2T_028622 [Vitis vinifera]